MTKKLLALVLVLAMMLVVFIPTSYAVDTMYVYTANGKTLNVRSSPVVGDNQIGSLAYGAEVGVNYFLDNGWACIVWGGYGDAYVQSRFLQWYKPGPKPTAKPTKKPQPQPTASPASDLAAELNTEFKAARQVASYVVEARPVRASGWVNLRWAPSQETEIIANYKNGDQLNVICELKNWLQVEDPETGVVGFIMQDYVSRIN